MRYFLAGFFRGIDEILNQIEETSVLILVLKLTLVILLVPNDDPE